MIGGWSKARHILRTEGARSFLDRMYRFTSYKWKRLFVPKAANIAAWNAMRNRYAGRRAFLIGNGPSLNRTPLYLLRDEYTMCFNRWDLMLERLSWTPSFYTVIDDRVLEDTLDIVNDLSAVADYSFFPDIHPYNVDFRDRVVPRQNLLWLYLDLTTFSDRLPYCGINKTVANVGLQILAFLGFTEIYLLGMDMTYSIPKSAVIEGARDVVATEDDDESHFDPRYFGKGRKFHVPMLDETFEKFREARAFFAERGVHIYNATEGGVLETFDRVALPDVLQVSPQEHRRRFLDNLRGKLSPNIDPDYLIDSAPLHNILDESARDMTAFRVPADRMSAFLRPYIDQFVPFGPFQDVYFYISRQALR